MSESASYGPGEQPTLFNPGDFVLHRSRKENGDTTFLGELIQAKARQSYGNTDFARWTHSSLIVSSDGDLVEAVGKGVLRRNISYYLGSDYTIVHLPACSGRRRDAVAFALAQVGKKYGYINFVGLALQALTGSRLLLSSGDQFICSGLVSRATEKYIAAYPRPTEEMTPADLAAYWGVHSGHPIEVRRLTDRLLDLIGSIRAK